jgi:hypothetical protein
MMPITGPSSEKAFNTEDAEVAEERQRVIVPAAFHDYLGVLRVLCVNDLPGILGVAR